MDQKKLEVLIDLIDIEGLMIGYESMFKGEEVNEDMILQNAITVPDIEVNQFNMYNILNIGQEAAINKSLMGRFLGRLNVLFSLNADSRMAKRAADLNLLYSGNVSPGPSKLRINQEAINLFLNAWRYQSMRREDVPRTEALRAELEKVLSAAGDNLGNAVRIRIQGMLLIIPLVVICFPIGLIYAIWNDIMFYYYLIMVIFASAEEGSTLAGHREEFMILVSNVVASCYMNGSGKKVKLEPNGKIPISEMYRIKAEIDDAKSRMDGVFGALHNGVYVEYNDKLKMVDDLIAARLNIQSKYGSETSRKLTKAYNVMAKNWNKIYSKNIGYSEHAVYCAQLADVMYSLMELSMSCDRNLTTIVRDLYKA